MIWCDEGGGEIRNKNKSNRRGRSKRRYGRRGGIVCSVKRSHRGERVDGVYVHNDKRMN